MPHINLSMPLRVRAAPVTRPPTPCKSAPSTAGRRLPVPRPQPRPRLQQAVAGAQVHARRRAAAAAACPRARGAPHPRVAGRARRQARLRGSNLSR